MDIQTIKELWSIVSFRKLVNILWVWLGFYLSKLLKRPIVIGQPFSVSYEPTTSCNLSCPECPTGTKMITRPKGHLHLDNFERTLNELAPNLLNIIFYFQGEPFLSSSLPDFIRRARYKKVFTMTSTNGHFLTKDNSRAIVDAGLHKLIVSVDGATQEVYSRYRKGGSLATVLQGIETLQAEKRLKNSFFPIIEMQFLVFRTNEHQIPEIQKLAKQLNIKLKLKSAQIYDYQNAHNLVPSLSKYARYRLNKDGKYEIKSKLPNLCWRIWSSSVITWDGKVVPCCFDKNAVFEQGNLSENTFNSIWTGTNYTRFRKKILSSRKNVKMCQNCTEGLKPEL